MFSFNYLLRKNNTKLKNDEMGQIASELRETAPQGTFKQVDGDSPEDFDDLHDGYGRERRRSLIQKITQAASLVPGTLAETEIFVRGGEKPLINHRKHGITNWEAGIQLFKVLVGTGILFMPKAFQTTGVIQGLILTAAIALLTITLNGYVVQVAQYFSKLYGVSSCSYSDTARLAFNKWPRLAPFSNAAQYLVSFLIFACTYGIMIIDVSIIAKNLQEIFRYYGTELNGYLAVLIQLPVQIVLNSGRNLKCLTPVTVGALMFLWSGIGLTTYYIINQLYSNGPEEVSNWNSPELLPSYFAISLVGFNSITALTSIENNMKRPSAFTGTPSVVCCTVSLAAVLYCSYGLLGYYTYGAATAGPVTTNIAPADVVALILKSSIVLGLMLTCPILFYPALSAVSTYLETRHYSRLLSYFSRLFQILIIMAVPLITEDVMILMELIGVLFIPLQYIMPVVIETLAFWDTRKGFMKFLIAVRNLITLIIGIAMMIITFYQGMVNVLNQ